MDNQQLQDRLTAVSALARSTDARLDAEVLRRVDAERAADILRVRVDTLEHFIKQQFPGYFAGEVGTVVDTDLNPIPIIYGEPQEATFNDNQTSRVRDADGKFG